MPTEQEAQYRSELAELRQRYEMKLDHFNALHNIAEYMKPEIRELEKRISDLEKKVIRESKNV